MFKFAFFIGLFWLTFVWAFGCKKGQVEAAGTEVVNFGKLPAFNDKGVTAVIEIPAGTNKIIEYDAVTNQFTEVESKVDFLPFPANYGFISSSAASDAKIFLPVLVLSEALPVATVLPVVPLGALLTKEAGFTQSIIVAMPTNEAQRIIKTDDFQSFMVEYDPVRRIIENWFLNYKGSGEIELIGWRDGDFALSEIKKRASQN